MRFHDPEVDRIREAQERANERCRHGERRGTEQWHCVLDADHEGGHVYAFSYDVSSVLADAIAGQPPERSDRAARHAADAILALIPDQQPDRPAITNPACPCWSGYHFLHRGVCGCPTCEPEEHDLIETHPFKPGNWADSCAHTDATGRPCGSRETEHVESEEEQP